MPELTEVKQVIVIRRDLHMRRGKEIAQGAHAAMAWLVRRLIHPGVDGNADFPPVPYGTAPRLSQPERLWLMGSFTKIVLQIPDEAGLLKLYEAAKDAGLTAELVTDAGRTEFGGVPTITALAIGPDWDHKIDPITRDLRSY